MTSDDGLFVQFVWIPDEGVVGVVTNQRAYFLTVEYEKNGILHQELFDQDDVIVVSEINIPIEREEQQ